MGAAEVVRRSGRRLPSARQLPGAHPGPRLDLLEAIPVQSCSLHLSLLPDRVAKRSSALSRPKSAALAYSRGVDVCVANDLSLRMPRVPGADPSTGFQARAGTRRADLLDGVNPVAHVAQRTEPHSFEAYLSQHGNVRCDDWCATGQSLNHRNAETFCKAGYKHGHR